MGRKPIGLRVVPSRGGRDSGGSPGDQLVGNLSEIPTMEVTFLPDLELAQYGIAMFAVAGLIFIATHFIDNRSKSELAEVIKNNTKALEQVTSVVQAIQLSLTRQEAKIDELLERTRR